MLRQTARLVPLFYGRDINENAVKLGDIRRDIGDIHGVFVSYRRENRRRLLRQSPPVFHSVY